jgi:hypothetical protein
MDLLIKTDLAYSYSWKRVPDDDSRISGEPDSTLFDRNMGYEILYLINSYARIYNLVNKSDGLKLERMIKENLPGNYRSQIHAVEWLNENWNNSM